MGYSVDAALVQIGVQFKAKPPGVLSTYVFYVDYVVSNQGSKKPTLEPTHSLPLL